MHRLLAALLLLALAVPARAGGQAVTFQADAAHTGFVHEPRLDPPLRRAWRRSFKGVPSYAVIAEGKVFVLARDPRRPGIHLHALAARTGKTVWSRPVGGPDSVNIAYGDGRVYLSRATSGTTVASLAAYSAATGAPLWESRAHSTDGGIPVPFDGNVYVNGAAEQIAAYRGADGAVLWLAPVMSLGTGAPAVTADAVYGTYDCEHAAAVRRADGTVLWDDFGTCAGAARTPVFHGGRLYSTSFDEMSGGVYDGGSGARLGPLAATLTPAFGGGLGLYPEAWLPGEGIEQFGHTLIARATADGRVRWRFRGDGYLDSAPLIVGRTAYVGSGSGMLYALSLPRGRVVWRADVGRPIAQSRDWTVVSGLAAGEGLLVVPAYGRLVAFRSR